MGILNMLPCIYKFSNKVNGKIYIGQASSVTSRLRDHIRLGNKSPMKQDVELYGWKAFRFEVLEFIEIPNSDVEIGDVLNEKEQYYIDLHIKMGFNFNTMFYNKMLFVDRHNYSPGIETRKKQSKAKRGMKLSREHIEAVRTTSLKINSIQNVKGHPPSPKAISDGLRRISKAVLQYDLDGNFVAEYGSQAEASEKTGFGSYNINKAVKGILFEAYNYQWFYKTDNYSLKIPSILRKVQILDYDKNFIKTCNSPVEASRLLGIHVNRVIYALNNSKHNYSAGHYFYYVNENGKTL